MDIKPKDFADNLVSFHTHHMKSAKTLWINKNACSKHNVQWTKKQFSEKFAYGIVNNDCFEDIDFDLSEQKQHQAERYGGIGIGHHGGGVRCGNDDNFQIKGIGKNPLAGDNSQSWHSYGGLNLVDAIYETINSVVLQAVLPIGVANTYGLIITGTNTAYLPGLEEGAKGYGALMIREACLRPAHFMRSPFYITNEKKLIKDSARTRQVNKKLAIKFEETNSFISQFGHILSNFANQFAFARAARIMHGSISTSNLCLDGRWLDLTNASFLAGGNNMNGSCSFYEEPTQILNMIEEFIYTYAKYNQIQLNPQPLFNYYLEQFDAYFKYHISYILGINFSHIKDGLNNKSYLFIADIFHQVITSVKSISTQRSSKLTENDIIVCLLEGLLLSTNNKVEAEEKLKIALPNEAAKITHLLKIFPRFLYSVYQESNSDKPYIHFLQKTILIALKRTLIPEYFFMGRLENLIYRIVTQKKEEQFEQVLKHSTDIAEWAFDKQLTDNNQPVNTIKKICLFNTGNLSINYCLAENHYQLIHNKKVQQFNSYNALFIAINKLPKTLFILSEYNFLTYLTKINNVLEALEKNFNIHDDVTKKQIEKETS